MKTYFVFILLLLLSCKDIREDNISNENRALSYTYLCLKSSNKLLIEKHEKELKSQVDSLIFDLVKYIDVSTDKIALQAGGQNEISVFVDSNNHIDDLSVFYNTLDEKNKNINIYKLNNDISEDEINKIERISGVIKRFFLDDNAVLREEECVKNTVLEIVIFLQGLNNNILIEVL